MQYIIIFIIYNVLFMQITYWDTSNTKPFLIDFTNVT